MTINDAVFASIEAGDYLFALYRRRPPLRVCYVKWRITDNICISTDGWSGSTLVVQQDIFYIWKKSKPTKKMVWEVRKTLENIAK
jgi:hypothetical protein